MQVCTSLQTDNHASTSPLSFLQAGCLSCRPTNSVKALKANQSTEGINENTEIKMQVVTNGNQSTCNGRRIMAVYYKSTNCNTISWSLWFVLDSMSNLFLQCFDTVGWTSWRASGLWKLSDEVLVWLSVWSEVQIVCMWSSWCHCIPKPHRLLPHSNPDWFYLSGIGLPKLSWKTGH